LLAQQPARPPAASAPAARAPAAGVAPAAAPGAASAAGARGFGTARGPLLTKEELRACLSQEEELRKRLAAHEAARVPLEQEKKGIADEQVVMRGDRAKLDPAELNAAIAAYTARNKAFAERQAAWEARLKSYNDAGRTGTAEERDALESERKELEKELAALGADRKRAQDMQAARQEAVQAFNVKIAALDGRVTEWNKRNSAYNDASAVLEADRSTWGGSCGNRRYREEDEMAIRAGK
jgi:chromosome segregation ATPase